MNNIIKANYIVKEFTTKNGGKFRKHMACLDNGVWATVLPSKQGEFPVELPDCNGTIRVDTDVADWAEEEYTNKHGVIITKPIIWIKHLEFTPETQEQKLQRDLNYKEKSTTIMNKYTQPMLEIKDCSNLPF